MARLAMILTFSFSLFLLSLARHSIDIPPPIETADESNTSLSLEDPNPSQSTDLKISKPIKEEVKEEDKQTSTLSLFDDFPDRHMAVFEESDPSIVIGWDPRKDEEEPKEEKVMKKKRSKRTDESDSDSDSGSDSDDEEEEECETDVEEEEECETRKKKKNNKKGGFLRWLWKLINRFD